MTAVDNFLNKAASDHKIIVNGRYKIPGPDGTERTYQRVSNFVKVLRDTYTLDRWSKRMTALGLARRPDLLARVAACTSDDKDELNNLCEEAQEAASASAGRNFGTALHAFAEQLDRGERTFAPEPLDKDLAAYQHAMQVHGVDMSAALMEQIVVLDDLGVAGRFDRIAAMRGRDLPVVADLKTGGHLDLQEIAVQLACYANADRIYDPVVEQNVPMPPVDKECALVIHLPVGQATCTLLLIDIAAGWEAVQLTRRVKDWRRRPVTVMTFEPLVQASAVVPQPTASEGGATNGVPAAQPPAPAGPRLLLEGGGPVSRNLERKVRAMDTEQLLALSVELAKRGLPKLSEATIEHQAGWLQAVKAVSPMLGRPVERTLPSGAVLHRPPTREWLKVCVEQLVAVEGGIVALQAALADACLPKLSECPDELLDEWAEACSVAGRVVDAPFAPMVDEVSPADPFVGLPGNEVSAAGDPTVGEDATAIAPSPAVVPEDIAAIVGGLAADPDMVASLRAECGDDLDALRVLVDAIDRCLVAFTYEGERPVLMATDTALDAITEAHGGKGAALKAAQAHAKTLGRPAPRTATAAATDPVLVAHTATKSA